VNTDTNGDSSLLILLELPLTKSFLGFNGPIDRIIRIIEHHKEGITYCFDYSAPTSSKGLFQMIIMDGQQFEGEAFVCLTKSSEADDICQDNR
jgi:hypothetical protein